MKMHRVLGLSLAAVLAWSIGCGADSATVEGGDAGAMDMDAPGSGGGGRGLGGGGVGGAGGSGSGADGGVLAQGGSGAGSGSGADAGRDPDAPAMGAGGASGMGGTSGVGGPGVDGGAYGPCMAGNYECNDCKDNDGDGKTDYFDGECTGPNDNDERSFATGLPGDNMDDLKSCKQDCFFDGNSGADEGCQRDLRCDPRSTLMGKCAPDSNTMCQPQSEACVKNCRPLTPNGCDCFGCCLVPGAANPIKLSATCTAAAFNDPTKCPACTQDASCVNTCAPCEVCIGKPAPDPSCFPNTGGMGGGAGTGGAGGASGAGGQGGVAGTGGVGGAGMGGAGGSAPPPPPACDANIVACGPGGVDPTRCPAGTYCITGCCVLIID